jgi:hypothetical protein
MKTLTLVLAGLVSGFISTAAMATEAVAAHVRITSHVDVSVQNPNLQVSLSYPGRTFSGLCGLEIRASGNRGAILKFLDRVDVVQSWVPTTPTVNPHGNIMTLDFSKASGAYLVTATIMTKNGRNLDEVIAET